MWDLPRKLSQSFCSI